MYFNKLIGATTVLIIGKFLLPGQIHTCLTPKFKYSVKKHVSTVRDWTCEIIGFNITDKSLELYQSTVLIWKHLVSDQHVFISFGFINLPLKHINMALELKIPSVGESVTEVTISQWLKQDGDYVEMDEAVAELESEKATVELNAEKAGVLKILVEEGEDVAVGAVVASIDTSAEKPESAEPEKTAAPVNEEKA